MFDKNGEAQKLAEAHYHIESGIQQIYRLHANDAVESQPNEPIKLLEVNEDTIAAGVMPLGFGPAPESGIHFPSVIVEVTPTELDRIREQSLPLPNDWKIGELLPRNAASAVA